MTQLANPLTAVLRAASAVIVGGGLFALPNAAIADWKPSKTVEIVTTCDAGCGPDTVARTLQAIWKKYNIVDADVIVQNKPGGGGAVAWTYVHSKKGDPHTIAIAAPSAITSYLTGRSPFTLSDMSPIAIMLSEYIGTAVRGDSKIKDAKQLIEMLKKDPSSISFASSTSRGNSNHQAIALAALASGVKVKDMKVVIFQSGSQALTTVLGGHTDAVQSSTGVLVKQHEAGEIRLVAVSAPKRLGGPLTDVPTWNELGIDAETENFRALVGSPGMTDDQVMYWENVVKKTMETAEFKALSEQQQSELNFTDHEAFAKRIVKQEKSEREILGELGILKR